MDTKLLLNKWKGCLLGALMGDCLGAPYEDRQLATINELNMFFKELSDPSFKSKCIDICLPPSCLPSTPVPIKDYTDDTVMTKATVESLIANNGLDCKDLAMRWIYEYFNDPLVHFRRYGGHVKHVFNKLRQNNLMDLYGPACAQFNGAGSLGNGGAMRVSPLALFFNKNYDEMIDAVTKATRLTHTHKMGVNGALLQAIAIQQSLQLDPENELDMQKFCALLIEKMTVIENVNFAPSDEVTYVEQLQKMEALLNQPEFLRQSVVNTLGNRVTALYSVPTAIFCFLVGTKPIADIKSDNPIIRTIQYAISLGRDTDTIATMGGAIAGAYYGVDFVDKNVLNHCAYSEETAKAAETLFACVH